MTSDTECCRVAELVVPATIHNPMVGAYPPEDPDAMALDVVDVRPHDEGRVAVFTTASSQPLVLGEDVQVWYWTEQDAALITYLAEAELGA